MPVTKMHLDVRVLWKLSDRKETRIEQRIFCNDMEKFEELLDAHKKEKNHKFRTGMLAVKLHWPIK